MPSSVKIVAQKRETSGSSTSRRLRRDGWLPGIISTAGGKSVAIQVKLHDFELALKRHGRENLLADIEIDGAKPTKTLLKEVQHEPVYGGMLHADFLEISMTRKMRVGIPIHLIGDPEGVTQQEGILEHILRELQVECLPGDMADVIDVNVSALKIGDAVFVRDIKVSEKLTVLSSPDTIIASVLAPPTEKVEEAAPTVAGAEAGAAEPELVGKKKEDGEEGEEAEGADDKKKDGKAKEKDAKPKEAGEPEKAKEKAKEKGKEKDKDSKKK